MKFLQSQQYELQEKFVTEQGETCKEIINLENELLSITRGIMNLHELESQKSDTNQSQAETPQENSQKKAEDTFMTFGG